MMVVQGMRIRSFNFQIQMTKYRLAIAVLTSVLGSNESALRSLRRIVFVGHVRFIAARVAGSLTFRAGHGGYFQLQLTETSKDMFTRVVETTKRSFQS